MRLKISAAKFIISIVFFFLIVGNNYGQVLKLVKKVNPTGRSFAGGFTPFKSKTIFSAIDGVHGFEWWITDGTDAGTTLLKDINPTGNSVSNKFLGVLNNQFLFNASDGGSPNGLGSELWISDGTSNGTTMVKDIVTGPAGSAPTGFIIFNNKVYFYAVDALGAGSLWASDGTANGTINIQSSINILFLQRGKLGVVSNGKLYFIAADASHGHELWVTDGTTGGTQMVKDIFPGTNTGVVLDLVAYNNKVYFTAQENNINGFGLWASDGTATGTQKVIQNGQCTNFTELNGKLYFSSSIPNPGGGVVSNLWVTDGSSGGTQIVKGLFSQVPNNFVKFGDKIYFSAIVANIGQELWVSDGTTAGSQLFADLAPGAGNSVPRNLVVYHDKLYFIANGNAAVNLYETGHIASSLKVIAANPADNVDNIKVSNGSLYFALGINDTVYTYTTQLPPIEWNGSVSKNWNNKDNWVLKKVPTQTDNVSFVAGSPNYPVISTYGAKCKGITIATGATLTMTAGSLSVYGEIKATDANQFDLAGGTLNLFHGSNFPKDMRFKNLNITNINDVPEDNKYKFPGYVLIHGNCKISGPANPTFEQMELPKIELENHELIDFVGNFTISHGEIGWLYPKFPGLADKSNIAFLQFYGNVSINNNPRSVAAGSATIACNTAFGVGSKLLTNLKRVSTFNLILDSDFDLAGKELHIIGKIVYQYPGAKISNSRPKSGKILIENFGDISYESGPQKIKIDRLRTLIYQPLPGNSNDTIILSQPLAVDTLQVTGFLDLNGEDLTIGSTANNLGFLDVDSLSASIALGTVKLLGDGNTPRYKLAALNLNDLVVNNGAGVELRNTIDFPQTSNSYGTMSLYGTANLLSGKFDIKGTDVYLKKDNLINSVNLGKFIERPGSTIINSLNDAAGVLIETVVNSSTSSANFGGLGFIITCSNPLNSLIISRLATDFTGGNGGTSIKRAYVISHSLSASGLNARIKIKYDESELFGLNESDLSIYRQDSEEPGNVWHKIPSAVNTTTNTVSSIGGLDRINFSNGGLTRYTLASASNPMRPGKQTIPEPLITRTTPVVIYPNPFTSNLTAAFRSEKEEMANIVVRSINGRIMHQEKVQLKEGSNNISICCMEQIAAGIYVLNITADHTKIAGKVIKK